MTRDKYGISSDPYCWPGTSILRNELGIRDEDLLADAEAEFAALALERIEINGPPFDLAYLCHLHFQLFGDLYEWAGQIRRVDVSKGATRFCTADRIVPEAGRVMRMLARIDFQDRPWPETLGLIAECFGELNLIHPFREGNGRTLRLFFEHLLVLEGRAVDWSQVEGGEWVAACIAAVACDYGPLQSIFDRCISSIPFALAETPDSPTEDR